MNIVLFEDHRFRGLWPVIYWRSVFALHCGRRTLMDRAARFLGQAISGLWCRSWIADYTAQHCQMPVNQPLPDDAVLVNGRWLVRRPVDFPTRPTVGVCGDTVVYVVCDAPLAQRLSPEVLLDAEQCAEVLRDLPREEVEAVLIEHPWDLLARNVEALQDDWVSESHGMEGNVSTSAVIVDFAQVHVSQGATIKPTAYLDATTGPIHISYDATIESHVTIQGPAYIGPGTLIKSHAHLHGGTSIGPFCKVGGEIDATIISGYSNKQHDGFLGHAYLGSWINIGAGTTNSDLKNTYGPVRMRIAGQDLDTGQHFLGAVIGDHTKIGINQTLPTGAAIGFAANIFLSTIVPRYVPSFAWLSDAGAAAGDPRRLVETARTVMQRRNVPLCSPAEALFLRIPELARDLEQPAE